MAIALSVIGFLAFAFLAAREYSVVELIDSTGADTVTPPYDGNDYQAALIYCVIFAFLAVVCGIAAIIFGYRALI